ncbi:hypothetical protein JBE27_43420, partial [Streptomyces albiflaviniger]|nr:hypothetical protein [Streptomyces albiflaviniger]
MARFLWLSGRTAEEENGAPEGGIARTIRVSDEPPRRGRTTRPLAFPERRNPPGGGLPEYRAARKEGTRAFTLWADPRRGQVFAQVVTKSATKGGPATYEVLGAAGESLALVTRRPAMKGG